jgi:hypothetical protein
MKFLILICFISLNANAGFLDKLKKATKKAANDMKEAQKYRLTDEEKVGLINSCKKNSNTYYYSDIQIQSYCFCLYDKFDNEGHYDRVVRASLGNDGKLDSNKFQLKYMEYQSSPDYQKIVNDCLPKPQN